MTDTTQPEDHGYNLGHDDDRPAAAGTAVDINKPQLPARPVNTDQRAYLALEISVIRVGQGRYLAAGKLAGTMIQANPKGSPEDAVRDVFTQMNNPSNGPAALALALALSGETPDSVFAGFQL